MNIKDDLKAEASALGFSFLAFSDCSAPESYPKYLTWLENGYHAGMAYMTDERSRQVRQSPARLVNGCGTVLVAGLPYPATPAKKPEISGKLTGRVAAYACARDYHEIIPELLQQLMMILTRQGIATGSWRAFSDSAPILERDLAQRAGAGWIGRNSCLVRPAMGSYFLLGEALISTAMEPDSPFPDDYCGSCQRCIQACPTSCILPERSIDSRRCISYLTIENRGSIPPEIRASLGNWVFGCDICQQVCPWNRFAPTDLPASPLHPKVEMQQPNLITEAGYTSEEFRVKYNGTPVMRAKYSGYLRNIAVALGNTRDPAAIPALAKLVEHHPDGMIRGHAGWALGSIGTVAARRLLEKRRSTESNIDVQFEIRLALQMGARGGQ